MHFRWRNPFGNVAWKMATILFRPQCVDQKYQFQLKIFHHNSCWMEIWYFILLVRPISNHYNDVIMGAVTSQITSLTIVCSTVDSDQRKQQSSASLAFVWGIHRGPVNSPHKWPATGNMFPFDNIIMWSAVVACAKFCSHRIACNGLTLKSNFHWIWIVVEKHDDVIKWKHFPRNWPFVWGIHRSTVNSPHKGLWRGALMFSLICTWINAWVNNREAGDWRRYRAH